MLQILRNAVIFLFISSTLFTFSDGEALVFFNKGEMYEWIDQGNNPAYVTDIVLSDNTLESTEDGCFKDEDIAFLVQNFTHVLSFHFENTNISDQALHYLKDLPDLKALYLLDASEITDHGIEIISQTVPQLEDIIFIGPLPKIKGTSMKHLISSCSHLRSLSINDDPLPQSEFAYWEYLSEALKECSIQHLQFWGYGGSAAPESADAWEDTFTSMHNLNEIRILHELGWHDKERVQSIKNLLNGLQKSSSHLESLVIEFEAEGDELVAFYQMIELEEGFRNGFPHLKVLDISDGNSRSSKKVFKYAKGLKRLRPDITVLVEGIRVEAN